MQWHDVWDFDPSLVEHIVSIMKSEEWEGRPWFADFYTFFGTFLPGTPFDVDTPPIPIRQKLGEPAEW